MYVAEKQGKRYLVINPESPLIQGFANVDDQFASFQVPTFQQPTPSPFFSMNGLPAFQLPTAPVNFGTRGVFPASITGPWSGAKMNGFPLLQGQTDTGGVFRGYLAVPIVSRYPVSPYTGYGGYNRPPTVYSHPNTPTMYQHLAEPDYYHQQFDNRPSYYPEGFGTHMSPSSSFESDYEPLRDLPAAPFIRDDESTRGIPIQYQPHDDYSHYQYPSDGQRTDSYYPHIGMEGFGNEQVGYGGNRINSENFGTMFNHGVFGGDRPNLSTEGSSSSRIADFGDPRGPENNGPGRQTSENFASMFDGDFGERSSFAERQNSNYHPFEQNDQVMKRSSSSSNTNKQGPPHPYVFTKEHVGFGPITVEAHTASYKGSDPKDDD
jgi:hypothetical protein